jgi:cAMP-dependent protein kinase regulator
MDDYKRSKLCDAVKEELFEAGQFIIREGEPGNKFYIIMAGEAYATKLLPGKTEPTRVFEYNKPGQYFGERALLTNEPRAASIITISPCKCLTLERETFERMLGNLKDILERNMDIYSKPKD